MRTIDRPFARWTTLDLMVLTGLIALPMAAVTWEPATSEVFGSISREARAVLVLELFLAGLVVWGLIQGAALVRSSALSVVLLACVFVAALFYVGVAASLVVAPFSAALTVGCHILAVLYAAFRP